ncbi:hypothetical protein VPNG_08946 [Cytospora leucostoma]|uniref:Uncharacterized protein n=1 Tax=Cytospora leucostoma TaxID=1230097 RepID=A0A423VW28_9PEZI|nr:hypothetical protein VPNG_08946 [Cytospora leucostoma]
MPSLKYFSSPAAVLPPMYILSAPSTSRKPSDEESDPRRRGCCGMGMPLGEVTPRAADCDCAAAAACAAIPREVDWAFVDTEGADSVFPVVRVKDIGWTRGRAVVAMR